MSPEDVLFKLGQLEPDEIARLMKDSGVLALRGCSTACAVTQYVYNETKAENISTGPRNLFMIDRLLGETVSIPLPKTVQKFVHNFDYGQYPELDAWWQENM